MRRFLVLVVFAFACGGEGPESLPDGGGGVREFAQPCETTADCASGLCLATGDESAVCTRLCETDIDCPGGPSWGCISAEGFEPRVCGCAADGEERCGDGRDNDCDGVTDDCRICDGRYVADDDPEHCGECGNACGAGNLCLDGECVCSATGDVRCDGACVDTSASPFHCGGCGNACEAGRECIDGACGCPDDRADFCEGRGCFDLTDDDRNCGACGNVCPIGQACMDGECRCSADRGQTYCGTQCVDTRSNAAHCGGCGEVCPSGISCVDGECACGVGREVCGGVCVSTATDTTNCGACGNTCRADQTCSAGSCGCVAGSTECSGVCVGTSFDPQNCGGCGVRCPIGASCSAGVCQCGPRQAACDGRCIDVGSDEANCGGCGITCRAGESCFGGTCTCSSGVYCGATCMPTNDPANCGACGNVCGASQSCTSGSCRCPFSSQTACGAECFDLRTDEANCGACGNTCRAGELCTSGRCACPSGQTWCESLGRCTNLWNDPTSCGSCGNTCRATEVCSGGTCRCSSTTQAWCDGACIDVTYDEANCGACGRECRATEICSLRACRCPVAGQQWCEGAEACIDTLEDAANCGGCGNVCPPGSECNGGSCQCIIAGLSPCADGCVDTTTDPSHCGLCGNSCGADQSCDGGRCYCSAGSAGDGTELYAGFQSKLFWNGTEALVLVERRGDPDGRELWAHRFDAEGAPVGTPVRIARSPNVNVDQVYPVDAAWNGTSWGVLVRSRVIDGVYSVHLYPLNADGVAPAIELFAGRSTSRSDQQWAASRVFADGGVWHVFGARNHAGFVSTTDALLLQSVTDGAAGSVRTVVPSSTNYALAQTPTGFILSHVSTAGATSVVALDRSGNAVASLANIPSGRPPGRQVLVDGTGRWLLVQHVATSPTTIYTRMLPSWAERAIPDLTRPLETRFSWGPNGVVINNVEDLSFTNIRRYEVTSEGLVRRDAMTVVGALYPDDIQHVQTGMDRALVMVRDGTNVRLHPVRFSECP